MQDGLYAGVIVCESESGKELAELGADQERVAVGSAGADPGGRSLPFGSEGILLLYSLQCMTKSPSSFPSSFLSSGCAMGVSAILSSLHRT